MSRQPIDVLNPAFAPPYSPQDGDKHLHVAQEWRAWWNTGHAPSHGGNHHRPEYYAKALGADVYCQAWQTTHATHRAGVYQIVVLPDVILASLHAEAQVRYHALQADGKRGELALRLGLLRSSGDGDSPGIFWGEWRGQTDGTGWDGADWETLSVDVPGPFSDGRVTVFVESRCRWPVRNNHAFVRGVAIVGEGEGELPDPVDGDLLDVLRSIDGRLERIAKAIEDISL